MGEGEGGGLSGKIREKLLKISSKVNFCDGRENCGLGGKFECNLPLLYHIHPNLPYKVTIKNFHT